MSVCFTDHSFLRDGLKKNSIVITYGPGLSAAQLFSFFSKEFPMLPSRGERETSWAYVLGGDWSKASELLLVIKTVSHLNTLLYPLCLASGKMSSLRLRKDCSVAVPGMGVCRGSQGSIQMNPVWQQHPPSAPSGSGASGWPVSSRCLLLQPFLVVAVSVLPGWYLLHSRCFLKIVEFVVS